MIRSLIFLSTVLALKRWTPDDIDRKLARNNQCGKPPPLVCMPSSEDSQCYCTDSTTGTLIDCCCQYELTKDWDLYKTKPILDGLDQNWFYYTRGDHWIANGGYLVSSKTGMLLNTARYNNTAPQNPDLYADNYKYLVLADEPIKLNFEADDVIQWVVKDAQTFLSRVPESPFPVQIVNCPGQDFRVASTVLMALDFEHSLQFGYVITGDQVYAIYARLPDQRSQLGNYAAFTFVVPILYRLPADEHKLKLIFSKRLENVRWQIGKKDVFRVKNVGMYVDRQYMTLDLGGAEQPVFPNQIFYGFGSMDFLNHYPACYKLCQNKDCCYPPARQALLKTGNSEADQHWNPIEGKGFDATFWDNAGRQEHRLWGQGSAATFRRITVYKQNCKYRYVHKDSDGNVAAPVGNGKYPKPIPHVLRGNKN